MYLKKWKHTKKVISLMVTVSMLSSAMGTTVAAESVRSDNQPIMEEEFEQPALNNQLVLQEETKLRLLDSQPEISIPTTISSSGVDVIEPGTPSGGEGDTNSGQLPDDSAASDKSGIPTYQEVYDSMIKLQKVDDYKEGTTWTNFEPYGTNSVEKEYRWKGGKILGNVSSGVGCAAFVFILSDEAFGELPARVLYDNDKFSSVKVGDILRINGNSHSVIVLRKTPAGVIVAEGNYSGTVHWGRVLTKDEVNQADFIVTRYPQGYSEEDNPESNEPDQTGTIGSLSWTLTKGGTLKISGNGAMDNFDDAEPAWSSLTYHTIIIENGVTSIGNRAFYQSNASTVYLPASLTSIGQQAFYSAQIVSVTIPGTVETIGNSAFQNCSKLVSVSVSEGVKTIGEMAFKGCVTLRYMDFPASITEVCEGAFMECKEMTRVRFKPGNSKVTIGDYLFARCWALTDVTLPANADCISSGMFTKCNMLAKLYIPEGITELRVMDKEQIAAGPFCEKMLEINFAGSEAKWNNELQGQIALTRSGCINTKV